MSHPKQRVTEAVQYLHRAWNILDTLLDEIRRGSHPGMLGVTIAEAMKQTGYSTRTLEAAFGITDAKPAEQEPKKLVRKS